MERDPPKQGSPEDSDSEMQGMSDYLKELIRLRRDVTHLDKSNLNEGIDALCLLLLYDFSTRLETVIITLPWQIADSIRIILTAHQLKLIDFIPTHLYINLALTPLGTDQGIKASATYPELARKFRLLQSLRDKGLHES